jgi:hypothetical protein
LLDDDVLPEVQDVPSAAEVAEPDQFEKADVVKPEPVKEVGVTEPENPEETLPVKEPLPSEAIVDSNDVREVPAKRNL